MEVCVYFKIRGEVCLVLINLREGQSNFLKKITFDKDVFTRNNLKKKGDGKMKINK